MPRRGAADAGLPAAGCPTRLADPLWKAAPCATLPRAIPNGNFPAGATFRLGTPRHVGVGLRVNEFKAPEVESWSRASASNGQNFSRGHHFFDHWMDQQQRAQLLVPALPRHSRADDLDRLWCQRKNEEAQREAMLLLIDYNERQRLERLQQTKSLLQCPASAQRVEQAMRRSCSAPELPELGPQAPALRLLNRRVDVNRLRQSRQAMGKAFDRQRRDEEAERVESMDDLFHDVATFEAAHVPRHHLDAMRTTSEWATALHPRGPLTPPQEADEDREKALRASRASWVTALPRAASVRFASRC